MIYAYFPRFKSVGYRAVRRRHKGSRILRPTCIIVSSKTDVNLASAAARSFLKPFHDYLCGPLGGEKDKKAAGSIIGRVISLLMWKNPLDFVSESKMLEALHDILVRDYRQFPTFCVFLSNNLFLRPSTVLAYIDAIITVRNLFLTLI